MQTDTYILFLIDVFMYIYYVSTFCFGTKWKKKMKTIQLYTYSDQEEQIWIYCKGTIVRCTQLCLAADAAKLEKKGVFSFLYSYTFCINSTFFSEYEENEN